VLPERFLVPAGVGGIDLAVPDHHQHLRDELRRRAARREIAEPEAHERGDGTAPVPGERLDIERALGRVPREARILLTLCYVDGLSYRELARVRGISINTVKSQIARGKAILRDALQRGSPDAARAKDKHAAGTHAERT